MKKYIEKTQPIPGIQYDGENWSEIITEITHHVNDINQITIIFSDENTISINRSENPEFLLYVSDYIFFDDNDEENILLKYSEDFVDENFEIVEEDNNDGLWYTAINKGQNNR